MTPDPDGIPSKVIVHVVEEILNPLTYLMNLSFEKGVFPKKLKNSRVTPIPKKEGNLTLNDIRPITITSVFSKIFEKLFAIRILKFLVENKKNTDRHHAYIEKRSTTTALSKLISLIKEKGDEEIVILSLDLTKAFDSVSTSLIVEKAQTCGIRGEVSNWLKSFLFERTQFVELNKWENGI